MLFLILFSNFYNTSAQTNDSTKFTGHFWGAVTLTTKGLSTFPNLTLGKPAAIFDLAIGGEKLRFEPQFRFSLEGKPWTFLLWWRYEIFKNEKLQFKLGAHPAYSFKPTTILENGKTTEITRTHKFLAGEVAPVFFLAKNISAGPYYLYARGITEGAAKNSNFISLRMNFSNIQLSEKLFLRWMVKGYYLKMDANDGTYVNSTLSLNRRNFPFSVSSMLNKAIKSSIPGDDFLWNINLIYAFGGKYRKI